MPACCRATTLESRGVVALVWCRCRGHPLDLPTHFVVPRTTTITVPGCGRDGATSTRLVSVDSQCNYWRGLSRLSRPIYRLTRALRGWQVRNAARVIGDPTLYRKMEATSQLIKRDIVFAASLYVA